MSARKSTRVPSARRKPVPVPKRATPATELLKARQRLALCMAVAYITSAALRAQDADSDAEAATVLRRDVGDELDRQIECLDRLAMLRRMVKPRVPTNRVPTMS